MKIGMFGGFSTVCRLLFGAYSSHVLWFRYLPADSSCGFPPANRGTLVAFHSGRGVWGFDSVVRVLWDVEGTIVILTIRQPVNRHQSRNRDWYLPISLINRNQDTRSRQFRLYPALLRLEIWPASSLLTGGADKRSSPSLEVHTLLQLVTPALSLWTRGVCRASDAQCRCVFS